MGLKVKVCSRKVTRTKRVIRMQINTATCQDLKKGHSITTWTRRGGDWVNRKSKLGHLNIKFPHSSIRRGYS